MKKRMIALFLTFAMLVPFTPAVAAEDTAPRPTVEEILSEYHQKAFEAEAAEQTGGTAAYSRGAGSSEKTLEEETVDTLVAAGYEAYNVTSENYEALEAQLQTDFADMGLDSDSSYIIVISGEEDSAANHARIPNPNVENIQAPDGGGDTMFEYIYNGTTYYMRYVTVVGTGDSQLDQEMLYTLPRSRVSGSWNEICNAVLCKTSGNAAESCSPIASILFLLTDVFSDSNYIRLDSNRINIYARTIWNLQYVQVYNNSSRQWISAQRSEYANSSSWCVGSIYNEITGEIIPLAGNPCPFTTYSPDYNNTALRKEYAARAYLQGFLIPDFTDDIDFYLMDEDLETNYCDVGEVLFTQLHWTI